MKELRLVESPLEVIIQRRPTDAERGWAILPSFRIGSAAKVIGDKLDMQPITAICLFPDFETGSGMIWGYKLGHEGNIFYPEDKIFVLVSSPE